MEEYYVPEVVNIVLMKEISLNTVNPLELIREGTSNVVDANAKDMIVRIFRDEFGQFCIQIKDNGMGMDIEKIQSFFNLGDSKSTRECIGEKGLGAKIYYKSNGIEVKTKVMGGVAYLARMDDPWESIDKGVLPKYKIEECNDWVDGESGTQITIIGYRVDNPEKIFSLEVIQDYILWFTAAGSFKNIFANKIELRNLVNGMDSILNVTIIDEIQNKEIKFSGLHRFTPPNEIIINDNGKSFSDNYCRHFGPFNIETNIGEEFVSAQIYGTVSGGNGRKSISRLRKGETHKSRFGLYLCKDFIPFSRRIDLIGDEQYYHYHILVNSQNFKLTSDRNNLSNESDPQVMWVLEKAKEIINKQIKPIAERGYFKLRRDEDEIVKIKSKYLSIQKNIKSINMVSNLGIVDIPIVKEPRCEYEVALLFTSLLSNNETRGFIEVIKRILTYSTKMSTDMVVETDENKTALAEVEFNLSSIINHKHPIGTYDYVICWNSDLTENIFKEVYGNTIIYKCVNEKEFLVCDNRKFIEIINLKRIVSRIKRLACNT